MDYQTARRLRARGQLSAVNLTARPRALHSANLTPAQLLPAAQACSGDETCFAFRPPLLRSTAAGPHELELFTVARPLTLILQSARATNSRKPFDGAAMFDAMAVEWKGAKKALERRMQVRCEPAG